MTISGTGEMISLNNNNDETYLNFRKKKKSNIKEIKLDNLFNVLQMERNDIRKYDSGEIYFLNDT